MIPPDHYFMRGTHPDSYDSRYAKFGLIDRCRFSGKAHPLF
ncbi:S26 family signal peptidase [uncultured Parasutterella sp.]|nr:S26 family signal peptidase [uncultured Parasutterella sp.]